MCYEPSLVVEDLAESGYNDNSEQRAEDDTT